MTPIEAILLGCCPDCHTRERFHFSLSKIAVECKDCGSVYGIGPFYAIKLSRESGGKRGEQRVGSNVLTANFGHRRS